MIIYQSVDSVSIYSLNGTSIKEVKIKLRTGGITL